MSHIKSIEITKPVRVRLVSCTGSKLREFSRVIPNGTRVLVSKRGVFVLRNYAPDKEGNYSILEFHETATMRIP